MLGPNVREGQVTQLEIAGHHWKSIVCEVDYTLMSETCSPGFDFRDWSLITLSDILSSELNATDKRVLLDGKYVHPKYMKMTKDGSTDSIYRSSSSGSSDGHAAAALSTEI